MHWHGYFKLTNLLFFLHSGWWARMLNLPAELGWVSENLPFSPRLRLGPQGRFFTDPPSLCWQVHPKPLLLIMVSCSSWFSSASFSPAQFTNRCPLSHVPRSPYLPSSCSSSSPISPSYSHHCSPFHIRSYRLYLQCSWGLFKSSVPTSSTVEPLGNFWAIEIQDPLCLPKQTAR